MKTFAVIGAGSWGTALAELLGRKGFRVRLWARNSALVKEISETGINGPYLPDTKLSANVTPTSDLREALDGAELIVCGVPSHGIRDVFKTAAPYIDKDALIVSASKGIEQGTYLTATEILIDVLCPDAPERQKNILVLSGPSFAKEVSEGKPAAVSVAGLDMDKTESVQHAFSTDYFRVYTNPDMRGVELGGALKNVMAIASGISDGLGLGTNARAALVTRGLHEVSRLGVKMGGTVGTFYGLSGLGDLVLTCTGGLSRNRKVGVLLGQGKSLESITDEMHMVAEGVKTSVAVRDLALKHAVDMPITHGVCQVLYDGKPPAEAVRELMTRNLKGEL